MSRGSFIRKAALGAAALAGAGSARVSGEEPDPYIKEYPDRLVVYPSGDPEQDWENLQSALLDYSQPRIYLNPKTKKGFRMDFLLPDWGMIEITRDVEFIGSNTIISGGDVAFYCSENFSLGIKNIIMRGQSRASVLGYFNDMSLVASGSDPIPLPEPASYGFIFRLSGALSMVNCTVKNARVGLFAEGMVSGHISSSSLQAGFCDVFLAGNRTMLSGNRMMSAGLSNVIVSGQYCRMDGNRFSRGPLANCIILSSAANTIANLGGGSVSSGSDPIPLPKPVAIDMGVNSRILGNYTPLPPPPYLLGRIEELIAQIDDLFHTGGEGGPDIYE